MTYQVLRNLTLAIIAVLLFNTPSHVRAQATLIDSFPHPPEFVLPEGIAFDGTHYWGLGTFGKIVKMDTAFVLVQAENGGHWWRSVFAYPPTGEVYGKAGYALDEYDLYRIQTDPFDGTDELLFDNFFQSHESGACISPNEQVIYDYQNGMVRSYGLLTGDTLGEIQLELQHPILPPFHTTIANDGTRFLTFYDNTVYAYDIASGAFEGLSQLPMSGLNAATMSFTNGRLFMFKSAAPSTWYAFDLNFVLPATRCFIWASCREVTYEEGGVAVQVRTHPGAGNFVSLDLISMQKDGLEAMPINTPSIVGLGGVDTPNAEEIIFYWETAVGESGLWDMCFEVTNDLGDADTCCHTVEVLAVTGDHTEWTSKHLRFREGESVATTLSLKLSTSFANTYAMEGHFTFSSVGGGAFLDQPILTTDVSLPSAFLPPVFESISLNTYGNDGVSPDSLLFSFIDFGNGALDSGTYNLSLAVSVAPSEGIIRADTTYPIFCCVNGFTHDEGSPWYSVAAGCYAITQAPPCAVAIAGDCNLSGDVTSADVISLVNFTFKGGAPPQPCEAAGDIDCSMAVTSSDIIGLVNFVFKSGDPPCDVCVLIWDGFWPCP